MAFQENTPTFTDYAINDRLQYVDSFLKEIDSIIDFRKLKPILNKNGIGTKNVCGVKAYDNILMFKILLLQKFYDLSDEKVEEALYVNLLFMKFVGLSLEDLAPDSTTIGRFRNSLIDNKIYDKLFNHVNKQLEDKGLIAKSGKSILVDATLIKSLNDGVKDKDKEQRSANKIKVEEANRTLDLQINEELKKAKPSRKKVDKLLRKKEHNSRTFKNQELDELQKIDTKDIETSKKIIENSEDSYDQTDKVDKEVRTGYQAGTKQYAAGYKGHIATDSDSGAILKPIMTFANTSDISVIQTIVEELEDIEALYGDKAYKSQEVDELLEKNEIENEICLKETQKMTKDERAAQRETEKPKHKIRAKVEHSFARIKTQMKYHTSRYTGLVRNNMNFTIACLASNLKLFAHKQIALRKVRNS